MSKLDQAAALWRAGQLDEAAELVKDVEPESDRWSDAKHLQGLIAAQSGNFREAARHLLLACRSQPENAELLSNLSDSLRLCGRYAAGSGFARRATELSPDLPQGWINLGLAEAARGNFVPAQAAFVRASTVSPTDADVWQYLAIVLARLGRNDDAAAAFVHWFALAEEPESDVLKTAGLVLSDAQRWQDASGIFALLAERAPEDAFAIAQLIHCQSHDCSWTLWRSNVDALLRRISASTGQFGDPFPYLSIPGISPVAIRKIAREFWLRTASQEQARRPIHSYPEPHVRLDSRSALRVGFLSCDFRDHPVGRIVLPLLEHLNHEAIEPFCYGFGHRDDSAVRSGIERYASAFRDVEKLANQDTAALIRSDRIDVLIDLTGWTGATRLGILAYRPAPVQATWLGYPGTLGVEGLADYLIGDPFTTPSECAGDFAERIVYLPNFMMCAPRVAPSEQPSRLQLGLPQDQVVFCSFATPYKINPPIFDAWCGILLAVPGSVVWMGGIGQAARRNLTEAAVSRGLLPARLVFADWVDTKADHIARLQAADVALDTYPYSCHSTALDILSASVPLVTLAGDSMASRVAAGAVKAVGLEELIASNLREYTEKAISLANDAARLAATKSRLRKHLDSSPLFDMPRFARDFEAVMARIAVEHNDE